MFQEVIAAVNKGETARARDLLTRLIQRNPSRADYWLWMSAVVDTQREQLYCLKEAQKREPSNPDVRRGLVILGVEPPDRELILPFDQQKRDWQKQLNRSADLQLTSSRVRQTLLYGGAGLLVVALLAGGVFGFSRRNAPAAVNLTPLATYGPSPTFLPTGTSSVPVTPPPPGVPTAPWLALKQPYTPTPIYVNTPHPRSEAYRTGLRSLSRGDYSGMITFMDQSIAIEPDAADLYFYKGEAYRLQKNLDQALTFYAQSVAKNPNFAPGYLGRALVNLSRPTPRSAEARRDLEKALEIDPDYQDARLSLAEVFLLQDDPEAAATVLEEAQDSPRMLLLRARVKMALQEPVEAETDARTAQQLDLSMLESYRVLGEILLINDQPQAAAEQLSIYLSYGGDQDAHAAAMLGTAYAQLDRSADALAAYEQSLQIDGNQPDVLLQRAALYRAQKEYLLAEQDLLSAQKIDRKSFVITTTLAQLYLEMEKAGNAYVQISSAEGMARTTLERAEVYYYRGLSLERLDKPDAAAKDWVKLAALEDTAIPAEWIATAGEFLARWFTPTPTETVTVTQRVTMTATPLPSSTATQRVTTTTTPPSLPTATTFITRTPTQLP